MSCQSSVISYTIATEKRRVRKPLPQAVILQKKETRMWQPLKLLKQIKNGLRSDVGEILVKVFKHHISKVLDEAMLRHPGVPRGEIVSAYRTANPNNNQYATKRYHPFYERGAEKITKNQR